MKLLIQSAMIFFGTLMAAAVVALGEPAQADVALAKSAVFEGRPVNVTTNAGSENGWAAFPLNKGAAVRLR